MSRETVITDYFPFLTELGENCQEYFVEGGQAVNFWAEYYTALGCGGELDGLKPFTSEDCDLWVSHTAWKYLKSMKSGHLQEGSSPVDGQLGILTIDGNPPLIIDLLGHVMAFPGVVQKSTRS